MLKCLTKKNHITTFEYIKLIIMVNEWINEGLHPITGMKEDFKRLVTKQNKKKHHYDYEFDINI